MSSDAILSLMVYGRGTGESVLLIVRTANSKHVYVIDAYSNKPYDDPTRNPILGAQLSMFSWPDVKGICLTHAHKDHFMGLEPVAKQTTQAAWIWPGPTPLDVVERHYSMLAKHRKLPRTSVPLGKWVAEAIGDLALWSQGASPLRAGTSSRPVELPGVTMHFIAPTDDVANAYARELGGSVDRAWVDKYEAPPDDLHNIPSIGIVVDVAEGPRVVLLGDMVAGSWASILEDRSTMALLQERPADIIKLPHHCSAGAMCDVLLDTLCDPKLTRAVLTPKSLRAPPPHESAIQRIRDRVVELWCTVELPRAGATWRGVLSDDPMTMLALQDVVKSAVRPSREVGECMVGFDVETDNTITVVHGPAAHRLK